MEKTCLKCGETADVDDNPLTACPQCGAIYQRVEALRRGERPGTATARLPPTSSPRAEPAKLLADRRIQLTIGALLVFFAGYFAGREHLKQQMAAAFSHAATRGLERLADGKTSTVSPPRVPAVQEQAANEVAKGPLTARLVSKEFVDGKYQDAIEFKIEFTNADARSIQAFDGLLAFHDRLDNRVFAAKVAVNDEIAGRGEYVWEGTIDYNQFRDEHHNIRTSDTDDLTARFTPNKVLFGDGQKVEY